jgi:hypothetical protein
MPDVNTILINAVPHGIADNVARNTLLNKIDLPENEGESGQFLVKTDTGVKWASANSTYTAFQVYPTDHTIEAGSNEIGLAVWNDETLTNMHEIPQSATEEFSLWINKSRLESDIVIDWGDGTVEKLSELTPTNGTDDDGQIDVLVYVAHTYEVPNQVYTIKVYGKDYCRLSHNATKLGSNNRLVCKLLSRDLPIAPHLTNLASFGLHCVRLLKVEIPSYSNMLQQAVNIASLFEGCKNLIHAYGFDKLTNDIVPGGVNNVFSGNSALLDTDFKFPETTTGCRNTFFKCVRLNKDIMTLFRNPGFISKKVDLTQIFTQCELLSGTIDPNIFWNNEDINWVLSTNAKPFAGCSTEISAQVPVSWGGSMSDKMIHTNYTYITIQEDTLTSVPSENVAMTIEFSNDDDFNEVVTYSYTDCQKFNESSGCWESIPANSSLVTESLPLNIRIKTPNTKYNNCRYCILSNNIPIKYTMVRI